MGQSLAEIIIIDDDPYFLEYLETLLERWGHKVWAFDEPKKALERMGEFPPQLLITDLYMPGLSGIEVLKAVRDCKTSPPVIGLSGEYEGNGLTQMKRLGAAAVFPKPLNQTELCLEIMRIIQNSPAGIEAE